MTLMNVNYLAVLRWSIEFLKLDNKEMIWGFLRESVKRTLQKNIATSPPKCNKDWQWSKQRILTNFRNLTALKF